MNEDARHAAGADDVLASTGDRPAFDVSVAHQARIYNYWLGGKDNYAADRKAAGEAIAVYPGVVTGARANRQFLARAVGHLTGGAGIRQFLDLGTGIPAANNTHEVAQAVAPKSRVVYVDYDPVVLAHARALLAGSDEGLIDYLDADLRETDTILEQASRTLDIDPEQIADATARLNQLSHQHFTLRDHAQVLRFFDGLELLEPGVARVEEWRAPDLETRDRSAMWGGVGRKP